MNNIEKYTQAFVDAFEVTPEQVPELKYQSIKAWDSVGHMALMAKLEEAFDIMMEPDDIVDFASFTVGKEMLSTKYGVDFGA